MNTITKEKAVPPLKMAVVDRILTENRHSKAKLIAILQAIQEEHRYLSESVISYVAGALKMPPAQVYGVATFYAHFSLEPKGKHIFRLCDGTACHVKKSHGILEALYKRLKLTPEKKTTDDMMFTVETVSCLGACGIAPVMLVDGEVFGQVRPEQAVAIVEKIIVQEKNNMPEEN
jgi:NADH-quinone oxidoreductase subunit E